MSATIKDKTLCYLISPEFNPGLKNLLMMVREQDPPLNLAMLAAWVRQKGFEAEILDCGISAKTTTAFAEKIKKTAETYPYHKIVVGFYVCTPTAYNCYELSHIVRSIIPDATIVAGGPHATFMYEEVLNMSAIEIAVIGEGEITLEEILAQKPLASINGIAYKTASNELILTPPRTRICNLDTLPIPAYDLLDIKKYRPPIGAFLKLPSFLVSFSRGCINNCVFCTKTLGKDSFQKSPQAMLNELLYLKNSFGIADFVIVDDTFTSHRQKVMDFCELLRAAAAGISWHAYTRVDHVDEELLKTMKAAGCHQVMFGIESFDENVLKSIGKNTDVNTQINAIKMAKKVGIAVRLSMMVGNIGDSPAACEKSIKMIRRLKPDYINVLIATPGPGTPFFAWAKENNRLKTEKWDKYKGATAVVAIENFPEKDIYKYFKKYYYDFYFNPSTIFRHIRKLNNRTALYNFKEAVKRIFLFVFQKTEE